MVSLGKHSTTSGFSTSMLIYPRVSVRKYCKYVFLLKHVRCCALLNLQGILPNHVFWRYGLWWSNNYQNRGRLGTCWRWNGPICVCLFVRVIIKILKHIKTTAVFFPTFLHKHIHQWVISINLRIGEFGPCSHMGQMGLGMGKSWHPMFNARQNSDTKYHIYINIINKYGGVRKWGYPKMDGI